MTRRRLLLVTVSVPVVLAVLLAVAAFVLFRPASLRARAERVLAERLQLDVTVGNLEVALLDGPTVSGDGIVLRLPDRPDLPPFVSIERFEVSVRWLSGLQVDGIEVDGLEVNVPPSDARPRLRADSSGDGGPSTSTGVLANRLVARDMRLAFVSTDPDKRPLTFELHELDVEDLGLTGPMPFRARLTNPVPKGLVETQGVVGPYDPDAPGALPIAGTYTLTDADLSTINGLGGILQSEGRDDGLLTEIAVDGTASAPDFSLECHRPSRRHSPAAAR